MWPQYHQSLLTELFQTALVKLCLENVQFTGSLELDGLFCISNGDISKQIVVKIHKVIQPSSANHGKTRSILKSNQTAQGSDEHTRPKDTALVVEVRRGKAGDSIVCKSEHSGDVSNSANDVNCVNSKDDKSSKAESTMLIEIPSSLSADSRNSRLDVVAVDLSVNSPTTQDNTITVGIAGVKEEQIQEMSMCDEDSVGDSIQVQDCSDIHNGLKCKHCQLNFSDLSNLETHLREIHGRFMCRQCLTTFSLSCNLRRHMKLHTGVRPHVCGSCNSSFSRSTDLKIHMKKHSNGKDSFSCSFCSAIFSSSLLLCQHKANIHSSLEDLFKCESCEKQFSSESHLKLHQKVHRESGRSNLNQMPNKTSDEHDLATGGDEDEMSFEDGSGSNRSQSPDLQPPASWTAHLTERVRQTKDSVQQAELEEKQNLPLDFKIKHASNELGKRISDSYIETVKEFAPLFSLCEPDDASLPCSRDSLVKSSENIQRALSLVQRQQSYSAPGKNKRKGMPVKHVKVNEDGGYYEITDDKVIYDDYDSDDDDDNDDVANVITASNCEGTICKTLAYNEDITTDDNQILNRRAADSSLDGLNDSEFASCRLNSGAFSLSRKDGIKLEKPDELHSASSGISSINNELENRVFTCRHGGCSTSWFGFAAYESHYISAHCRYPCELCDQSFTSRNNRRRHANGHGNVKKHNCDRCDKLFARPDIVKEHRITHTKSYQTGRCVKCEFTCVKKTMLLSHLKRCLTVEDVDSDIDRH